MNTHILLKYSLKFYKEVSVVGTMKGRIGTDNDTTVYVFTI